jgi:hypothetical protein
LASGAPSRCVVELARAVQLKRRRTALSAGPVPAGFDPGALLTVLVPIAYASNREPKSRDAGKSGVRFGEERRPKAADQSMTNPLHETFFPTRALGVDLPLPADYSVPRRLALVALLFTVGGGVLTAPFSASIARFMIRDTFAQALAKGLVIPMFTWAVQLLIAWRLFRGRLRYEYAVQLGIVCTVGSVSLWPSAAIHALVADASPWISAANVYLGVWIMGAELYRRGRILGLPAFVAPVFLATIHVNMALFATSALTTHFDGLFHKF